MRQFWIDQVDKYEGNGYWSAFLARLKDPKNKDISSPPPSGELADLKKKAEDLQSHAKELEVQSHELHEQVTWIDIGHLGLELALVFCAVAVLTKMRGFWLTGMGFAVVGFGLAAYGIVGWWQMGAGGLH
jgi:hypothetical protein